MSDDVILDLRNLLERAEAWQDDALCAQTDPALFFPEQGESSTAAKRVCARCPVSAECLEHALEWEARPEVLDSWGVYGGLSADERERILTRGGKRKRGHNAGRVGQTRAKVLAVLEAIGSDGRAVVPAHEIAELCGISRSAAAGHIRRLLRDGLLEADGLENRVPVYRIVDREEGDAA